MKGMSRDHGPNGAPMDPTMDMGGAKPGGTGGGEMGMDDAMDQHAFVMLGAQTLFLAHLTMFHMEDHLYQLVVRASLPDDAMAIYRAQRKLNPDETYFLGNSGEDLLTVPQIQTGMRNFFIGDIFRGIPKKKKYLSWPWKGQRPVISRVRVTIERVVHYRHFDFNLEYPRDLTYLLFGAGNEAHLHHYQVKQPDFDHTLSLAEAPAWLPVQKLEAGVPVNFPSLPHRIHCTNPLVNKRYEVQYAGRANERHHLKIGRSWWCSTKVVNDPDHDPCAGSAPTRKA